MDGECRVLAEDPDGGPFNGGEEDNPDENNDPTDDEQNEDDGVSGTPDPGEG